jgi:hypothetical protein
MMKTQDLYGRMKSAVRRYRALWVPTEGETSLDVGLGEGSGKAWERK